MRKFEIFTPEKYQFLAANESKEKLEKLYLKKAQNVG